MSFQVEIINLPRAQHVSVCGPSSVAYGEEGEEGEKREEKEKRTEKTVRVREEGEEGREKGGVEEGERSVRNTPINNSCPLRAGFTRAEQCAP